VEDEVEEKDEKGDEEAEGKQEEGEEIVGEEGEEEDGKGCVVVVVLMGVAVEEAEVSVGCTGGELGVEGVLLLLCGRLGIVWY
jgi:hypothetical protein